MTNSLSLKSEVCQPYSPAPIVGLHVVNGCKICEEFYIKDTTATLVNVSVETRLCATVPVARHLSISRNGNMCSEVADVYSAKGCKKYDVFVLPVNEIKGSIGFVDATMSTIATELGMLWCIVDTKECIEHLNEMTTKHIVESLILHIQKNQSGVFLIWK